MAVVIVMLFLGGIGYVIYISSFKKKPLPRLNPIEVENLLLQHVVFYRNLPETEKKKQFLERVLHFLQTTRFTDVGKAIHTLEDEILIAASAMIPLYHFPDWNYFNLDEILLYEDAFNTSYETNEEHAILGMVGEGALQRTMLLSLKSLRQGFEKKDAEHTAIHEFVHLIDKMDGSIDGVPEYLIPKEMVEPWLRLVRNNIQQIQQGDSTIDAYAATNEAEFFAVLSEYFFEKPEFLNRNHPVLYQKLRTIFERHT